MRKAFTKSWGFTLIELILVVAVIAILAVIAVPRWTASSLTLEGEARRVLHDIRYTQLMSMATGERYRWVRVASNAYSILNESGTPVVLPSGGTVMTLTSGAYFGNFSNLPNNLIAFSTLGVPYTNTSLPGSALAASASIVLQSGSESRLIVILPETGFGGLS